MAGERMVRLKAPRGVTGVEWGGEFFLVKNGHVLVPIMAEPALTRAGPEAFSFPDEPRLIHEAARPVLSVKRK